MGFLVRKVLAVGAASAMTWALLFATADPAAAATASNTLYTTGGKAYVTRTWTWLPSQGTYKVTYSGRVYDTSPDGSHIEVIRWADGRPVRIASVSGNGNSKAFDGGPIYAKSVHHQVCRYYGNTQQNCSPIW